ncbi:UreD urease accessory protein-domain-containing protein [Kockovaella imperatae]|uniref:UreD urease accessory protein-domain-containing protein n=1 Tax=Kockovaella imperatae TaxID=4999 RepID=A0A1Y1URP7_9TREE|nr:UreD urease accessory protein-domain-containing protein [Kockovaella imperatae]ORX40106.1 UreD urease accessory protein-domain-containing protein [Kockovaella imperatae]
MSDEPDASKEYGADSLTRDITTNPGSGYFHLSTSSTKAQFSALSASYPLKLLSPKPLPSQPRAIGVLYTLAYGGGLVAGDTVSLRGNVDKDGGLVMLTQGSTKVFKHRPGIRPSSLRERYPTGSSRSTPDGRNVGRTRQRLHITLRSGSFLMLLPDSVSPFTGSQYAQSQRFVLPSDDTASVLVLDWVNSGRGQRSGHANGLMNGLQQNQAPSSEIWSMDEYISTNEVTHRDKILMREKMVLNNANRSMNGTSIATRLSPYHVYGTVLILGPHFAPLIAHLVAMCDATRQFKMSRPVDILWSFSPIQDGKGGVLRIAGKEVEDVRRWLKEAFQAGGIRDLVGEGLWTRII